METAANYCVTVRNAYKGYVSHEPILNNLNMTVPEGVIYGLLGPSGCGKTTLLNCIAGRLPLDFGTIQLKIKKRSEMGFMPQSLCIHDGMTISESFYFYGTLFNLSKKAIDARTTELISFLALPSKHRMVSDLSGGQQRRVSLAISIFHDPKLLILDEPTVGLDPILSQSVWEHLLKLASTGKTIIITTHYIQEAHQAHVIGLFRNGKLLAEESPSQLIEKCNCNDLEEAFLKLSQDQEHEQAKIETHQPTTMPPSVLTFQEDGKIICGNTCKAVLYKDWIRIKRAYTFWVVLFALPIGSMTVFGMSAGRIPKHLPLGVVNDEISLSECQYNAYSSGACFLDPRRNVSLSCLYLDLLRNLTYNFIEYPNETVAVNDIRGNRIWGVLRFYQNYTVSMAYKLNDGTYVNDAYITNSTMQNWLDLSNAIIGNLIKYDIVRLMQEFLKKAVASCAQNPKLLLMPLTFEEPIFGSPNEEFTTYSLPGYLCLFCFYLPSLSASFFMFADKDSGVMGRMLISGVSINEMVLSQTLIHIVLHAIQSTIVLVISYKFLNFPFHGSWYTLNWLLLITALSGMYYGVVLAILNKSLILLIFIGVGVNMSTCFTSGFLSSIHTAHYLLKITYWIFPLSLTIDAVRGIAQKGFVFSHPTVLKGFAGTMVWNILFIIAIFVSVKYKNTSFSK